MYIVVILIRFSGLKIEKKIWCWVEDLGVNLKEFERRNIWCIKLYCVYKKFLKNKIFYIVLKCFVLDVFLFRCLYFLLVFLKILDYWVMFIGLECVVYNIGWEKKLIFLLSCELCEL